MKNQRKMTRITLLLLSVILCACSAQKSLTKSTRTVVENIEISTMQKDSINIDSVAVVRDSITAKVSVEKKEVIKSDNDDKVVIITREYDTSKPIMATGVYPLKKETTETRRKTDKTKTTKQTDISSIKEVGSTTGIAVKTTTLTAKTEDTATQRDTDIVVEDEKKRGLNVWQNFLCWLGGSVILIGLVWVAWKLLKKHLKPF